MRISLLTLILAIGMAGCAKPKSKIDMKTDVEVIPGAEPMKLGEILLPASAALEPQIVSAPKNAGCQLIRSNSADVANITGYEGAPRSHSPLFFVKEIKYRENPQDKTEPLKTGYSLNRADITDVVVTATEKPVNLLLTSHDASVWVIHPAAGVKIEAINVMSYEGGAVIAPGVDPKRIKFVINSEITKKCWKKPERYTNAKEKAAVKPANYERKPEDFERYRKEEQSYKAWLNWVGGKVGLVKYPIDREYRVEAALVGPNPSAPIAATPVGGQVVVDHSRYMTVFWGSKRAARQQYPKPKRKK